MESDEQTEIGGIQLKVNNHRVMDQYAPVSYTHLDVYKRQSLETMLQRWYTQLENEYRNHIEG